MNQPVARYYHTNPHQEFGKALLRASNRFLITQSAGNTIKDQPENNACPRVYNVDGRTRDYDAILSIGAINSNGERMRNSENNYPGSFMPDMISSMYGHCVDFYAPGGRVYGYINNSGGLNYASGTSFAAPIVAAIASRYGDTKTRPLERESYLKSILVPTGHSDGVNPIRIPRYSATPNGVLKYIPIERAIAPVNNHRINYIRDNMFFKTPEQFWSASSGSGSLTVDVGRIRNIRGIRIVLETSSPGKNPVHFDIYGSREEMIGGVSAYHIYKPTQFIKRHTETFQYERAPIFIPLNGNYRSIRIDGLNPTSWFAVVEVEVYGY